MALEKKDGLQKSEEHQEAGELTGKGQDTLQAEEVFPNPGCLDFGVRNIRMSDFLKIFIVYLQINSHRAAETSQ